MLCGLTSSRILVDLEGKLMAHAFLLTQFPPGPNLAFLRAKSLLGCSDCCHLWLWPQPISLELVFPVAASLVFWKERNTVEVSSLSWGTERGAGRGFPDALECEGRSGGGSGGCAGRKPSRAGVRFFQQRNSSGLPAPLSPKPLATCERNYSCSSSPWKWGSKKHIPGTRV